MNPYDHLSEDEAHEYIVERERKTHLGELDEMDFMEHISGHIPKHLNYDFVVVMLLESGLLIDVVIEDEEVTEYSQFQNATEFFNFREETFEEDYPSYATKLVTRIKNEFSDVSEVMILRL